MSRHVSHPSVNANGHLSPSESTLPPYIARSSYPPFLPFHQTVKLQLISAAKGLWDASRWDTVIRVIARDAEVRSLTFKSILLNTMSLASVYFFDLILVPMSHDRQSWLYRYVGRAYQIFWLLPVVGASFFNNVGPAQSFSDSHKIP
ncbi:hypothetical protein QCA50_007830 [Cerrena zonata]|uniref:Uncharacterized protein n=1 Tax=Cerrena zonata TaxID=2478898 RepID=A0AAW0GH97_9APHY